MINQVGDGGLLCLELDGALTGRTALGEVGLGILRQINQIVALLERCHVTFHAAQVLADNLDTLVDEVGRTLRQQVLVRDDATLVGIEQGG